MKGYKGFNKDMTCRGFQYEEGKTYKMEEEPKCCEKGFHFCENPIGCLAYYSPTESVYREVQATGKIDKDLEEYDTKAATNRIKVGPEVNFQTMAKEAMKFTYNYCTKKADCTRNSTGYKSIVSGTGESSVASNTGDCSVASSTGDWSVAENLGQNGIASCLGIRGKARGKKGNWLVIAEWILTEDAYWEIQEVKAIQVDGKKIKEDTYYALKNGEFVEK